MAQNLVTQLPPGQSPKQPTGGAGNIKNELHKELVACHGSLEITYLSAFSIPAHLIDHQGIVIDVNQCELDVLGYSKDECVGRSFAQFVVGGLEQYNMRLLADESTGALIPLTVRTKAGERKHFLLNFERRKADGNDMPPPPPSPPSQPLSGTCAQPSSASSLPQFLCVLHDDVAKHMAAARESAAAKLVSFQDSFIRRIFHKMRTPLHVMCNALDTDEFTIEDLIDVRHNAEGLLGVVEDLTFSAMMEMGKLTPLNPKAVHLPTVLHEALETAFNVDERGSDRDSLQYVLRLDKDVPECVCVDSSLQRVIFNLASNGMKFCSAHGTVVVIVSYVSTSPSPSALSSSSAPSSSSSSPTSSQAGSSYPSSLNPSQKCDKDLPDPTPAPQMSHSHLHSHSHSHRDSGRDSGFFTFTVSNSYDSGSLSGKAEILKFLQFTGSATAAVGFGSDALNNNSSSSNNSNISSNINTNISSAKASRPIGTAVPRPHPLPDTSSLPSLSLSPVSSPRPDFPSDDRGGKEGTKEGLPPGPSGSQPAAPAPTHSRPPPLPDHSFSMKATERTGLQTAFNMVHVMGGRLECSQTSHDTKFFFTVKLDVAGAGDIISSRFNPVVSTASRRGSPITSNRPSPYSSRRTSPYTSRNASGRTSPHHSAENTPRSSSPVTAAAIRRENLNYSQGLGPGAGFGQAQVRPADYGRTHVAASTGSAQAQAPMTARSLTNNDDIAASIRPFHPSLPSQGGPATNSASPSVPSPIRHVVDVDSLSLASSRRESFEELSLERSNHGMPRGILRLSAHTNDSGALSDADSSAAGGAHTPDTQSRTKQLSFMAGGHSFRGDQSSQGSGNSSENSSEGPNQGQGQGQGQGQAQGQAQAQDRQCPCILIVDDSQLCQKIVKKILSSYAFSFETAFNGQEAVDKLAETPLRFDAVLMDIRMPVMDGIQATKHIREVLGLTSLPIVALSAEIGVDVREAILSAGANCLIGKPASAPEIMGNLSSLIQNK